MNSEMQNPHEPEVLDPDHVAVSHLVASLDPVKAPDNFEHRVMARIAERAGARRSPFQLPTFAYVVSLIVLLLFGSFIAFQSFRRPIDESVIAEREGTEQPGPQRQAADNVVEPASGDQNELVAETNRQEQTKPARSGTPQVPKRTDPKIARGPGGGSYTVSVRQPKLPDPTGIDTRNSSVSANRSEAITAGSTPVVEILSLLGITANYENGWRVNAVRSNSTAHRSGIVSGDVVLSLGANQLTANTEFKSAGTFSTIRVRRAGQIVELKLK